MNPYKVICIHFIAILLSMAALKYVYWLELFTGGDSMFFIGIYDFLQWSDLA